jgi:hypothetical protein
MCGRKNETYYATNIMIILRYENKNLGQKLK